MNLFSSKLYKTLNVIDSLFFASTSCRSTLPMFVLEEGARGGLSKRWQVLQGLGYLRPTFVEADLVEHEIGNE